jgi:hypothetical protein
MEYDRRGKLAIFRNSFSLYDAAIMEVIEEI